MYSTLDPCHVQEFEIPLFFQETLAADNEAKEVEVEACQEPTEEEIKELIGPKKNASEKKID